MLPIPSLILSSPVKSWMWEHTVLGRQMGGSLGLTGLPAKPSQHTSGLSESSTNCIEVELLTDPPDMCRGSGYGYIWDTASRVLTSEAALDKMIN